MSLDYRENNMLIQIVTYNDTYNYRSAIFRTFRKLGIKLFKETSTIVSVLESNRTPTLLYSYD